MEKIAAVIVASDSRSDGRREDLTGPAAVEALEALGLGTVKVSVVPDEVDSLANEMIDWCDRDDVLLVLTCGGTGLAPRDVTRALKDRQIILQDVQELLRGKNDHLLEEMEVSLGGSVR